MVLISLLEIFIDYAYPRDCSNKVTDNFPSFNKKFGRLKKEVLAFCISDGLQLTFSSMPIGHGGGTVIARSDGSAQFVPMGVYRHGITSAERIKLIDNSN